jgi:hypothetical protein
VVRVMYPSLSFTARMFSFPVCVQV